MPSSSFGTPTFLQMMCPERLFKDLNKKNIQLLFSMGFGLYSACAFILIEYMIWGGGGGTTSAT